MDWKPFMITPSTTMTLTASSNTAVFGQPVTLTVTFQTANPSAGMPIGMVFFQDSGHVLGSAPVDGSGQATYTAVLAPGGHVLSAVFSGDGTFARATSATVNQFMADQPVTEITGQVTVNLGRLKRRGGRALQMATITNVGGQPFEGPLSLVLDRLKRPVKLVNRTGFTSGSSRRRSPYLDVLLEGGGILEPGQVILVALNFKNPNNGRIRFIVRVLAGVGVR